MITDNPFGLLEGVPSNTDVPLRPVAADRYTSQEFQRREVEDLWAHTWQLACRVEDVPTPGSFFEYKILDQSVLIIRQRDGGLKAMANACRHRGAELTCGAGTVSELRCPFHAWTYDLDGSLIFVTSPDEFPPTADYHLVERRVETWGGFIFINFDRDAPPLAKYLEPAASYLEVFDPESWRCTAVTSIVTECNWKATLEAFMEGYHGGGTHPQMCLGLDDVNIQYENLGAHGRFIAPSAVPSPRIGDVEPEMVLSAMFTAQSEGMDDGQDAAGFGDLLVNNESPQDFLVEQTRLAASAMGIDLSDLPETYLRNSHNWGLFPNMLLQCTALQMLGWRARPYGNDPDKCYLDMYVFRRTGPLSPPAEPPVRTELANWQDGKWGLLLTQDFENLPKIQRGLHQRDLGGVLLSDRQEVRIRHLHDVIDLYMEARTWAERLDIPNSG